LLKSHLIGKLNPYGKKKAVIVHDQGTGDIIKAMLTAHKIYAPDYDKIALYFWKGDVYKTAKFLFDFCKKNIKYKIESDKMQRIMSPAAILALSKNDCKNYSLFINGCLHAMQRAFKFKNKILYRFASYRILDETPHHVFAVLIDDNGNEIFIDPVLNSFNEKKTYYHKIDYSMPLYSISGTQVGLFGSQKRKKEFEKAKVEAKAQGLPEPEKPKSKVVLKIALAPARGAFLALLGLNFMGLATKLSNAFKNNKDKVNNFWSGLGGNTNELLRKTEQGAKKKRILGDEMMQPGEIGVVSTAAFAATAAPILLKVGTFLKSLGIDPGELVQAGKKVLADQAKKAITKISDKVNAAQEQGEQELKEAVNTLENKPGSKTGSQNYIPYVIGAGVILYLISKKRK
jgi:hypothetical protein